MSLKEELQKLIAGEVLEDAETLAKYSKDASIYEITPQVVVFPKDTDDLKKLVKFASANNLSITVRSGGTDMSGGAVGESIVVDMTKYFNKIKEVGEGYAITQPGVFYRDFEKETLAKGYLLPCYPASREICTVGGMVSNNSAGEKTLSYGQTHDYVMELKMILSDGNEYTFTPLTKEQLGKKLSQKDFEGQIYKQVFELIDENYDLIKKARPNVSKNSSGYLLWDVWNSETFNPTQIFTGAQGTLGIVTQIKFRLIKPKKYSKLLIIFLYNLNQLGEVVDKVLESKPESFESFDDQTTKFAARFWMEIFKVIKPKNILSLGLSFIPEILMTLQYGFPKLILMAEFTGDSLEQADQKAKQTQENIKAFHIQSRVTTSEDDARKYWVIRRESFNLFRHHAGGKHTAPFIDDLVVKPEVLPEFLPKLEKILEPYKKIMIYTIAGHVGNGNFHIIPLVDLTDMKIRQAIPQLSKKVYDLVFEYKGSMAAEHNDGLVRGPYLEQMYGEDIYQLFKKLKSIFDSKDIFNPHKKVDATFEYSLNHIAKKN
ncbi:FAD-binding oxidoreductase [Candidatus Daviesbacteria bacterium]|nr:FAD-binding oxidoreductase [Candidatus Daviesbacteria bacterium]